MPIKKKICMTGAFAVGKTSLVQRYVKGIFSEKYLTTLGVKIDKKTLKVDDQEVELLLWDIQGDQAGAPCSKAYLKGASGYFLVADGTRRDTLHTARRIQNEIQQYLGEIPFILLINKYDLTQEWMLSQDQMDEFKALGWIIMLTSAQNGTGVEDAFAVLARKILGER